MTDRPGCDDGIFDVALTNRDGLVVQVGEGQTILDAAEAAGMVLPYGCRFGGCVTCAARLVSGTVDQPQAVGLKDYMAEAGFVLTCVARPTSDCELEVGVSSHYRGLYRNPFRSRDRIQTDLLDTLRPRHSPTPPEMNER